MIPHKQSANVKHTIVEVFYDKHLFRSRSVVENVFCTLKKTFKELLLKNNLSIIFILDVVCCCMFYNLVLNNKDVDVNALMHQLEQENQHNPQGATRKKT
jgi:hypothetical protein